MLSSTFYVAENSTQDFYEKVKNIFDFQGGFVVMSSIILAWHNSYVNENSLYGYPCIKRIFIWCLWTGISIDG